METELFRLSAGLTETTAEHSDAEWKTAISHAIYSAEKSEKDDGNERAYCFEFSGTEFERVIEFIKLKNCNWKKGIEMSPSTFSANMIDSENKLYRHIASDIKKAAGPYSYEEGKEHVSDVVLSHLVGTDRVINTSGEKMEVVRTEPAIMFTLCCNHINVISNVKLDNWNNLRGSVKLEGKTFYIVTPDEKQRSILNSLLKIKSFPLAALPYLIDLSEKIREIITIDESSLMKLAKAPNVQGNGRIVVKVSPDRTVKHQTIYNMTATALPSEDNSSRFTPGDGPSEFVADINGKTTIVSRNFQAEKDNFDKLSAIIRNLSGNTSSGGTPENLLQLLEFVHNNPDDYAVEWPKGEEIKFKGAVNSNTMKLFVATGTQREWFSLEGIFSPSLQVNTQQLLSASLNSSEGEYVRIGEKEYVRMTSALKKQLSSLAALGHMQGKDFVLPRYFVGELAEIIGQSGVAVSGDNSYQDLLHKIQEAYASVPEVPTSLNGTLRDYQVKGFQWMSRLSQWGAGACLADDMGLGKTIQTIAFILSKAADGPSLVIAPTTVVANWKNELGRFAPTLNAVILNNENDRDKAITSGKAGDVLLASYGLLTSSGEKLSQRDWNIICLDEAHQIKNRFTKVSESAMELKGKSKLILTGTPIQNNISELWNLMQFLNPGLLGPYKDFSDKYMGLHYSGAEKEEEDKNQLKAMIRPFILRRIKEEVIRDIPIKTEFDYMINLTDKEMAFYEEERTRMESFYNTVPAQQRMKFFFGDLGKLRRMACSIELEEPRWEEPASKIRELQYLLNGINENKDNHIVLFSQYTEFLVHVRRLLDKMGIQYKYMDGSTPMGQRESIISDFQSGNIPVFVCSLKAGGVGINLTAANYVILLDPWWNPAVEQQAMDRAYRIGQIRDVMVIRMITHHTIEEKVIRLQEQKKSLSDSVLEGTSETASLTYEDIKEMLRSF